MTVKETVSTLDTNQITTSNLAGPQPTSDVPGVQAATASPRADPLSPPEGPNPQGESPAQADQMAQETEKREKMRRESRESRWSGKRGTR
jgi:hypothetical protein